MSSPLNSIPSIPFDVSYISDLYFDISLYKENYDNKMPLSLVESYQTLFNTKIHPFIIECIFEFDRVATNTINSFIIKQQRK